jgi:sulfoxide reductase heme-binding subunit YedZ
MAAKLSKSDVEFTKTVAFANALVPLGLLGMDLETGRAGANPLEYATHVTGMLALVFIVLSLAVTPLRRVSGLQWLAQHRRMMGLFAYFYAIVHLVCYWWFDKGLNVADVVVDVFKRPFIAVGMATVLVMTPLAVTSTNAMIKRIGGRRWRVLHRLNYAVGVGAALHYFMLVKADTRLPLTFFAVVGILLVFRFVDAYVLPIVERHQPVQPSKR